MPGSDRFSLEINAKTSGQAEIDSLNASFAKFAESVKNSIQDPLAAAGGAVESLLKTFGPAGTAVVAAAGAFVAFGKAAYDAAKSLGEYGLQLENASVRLGLSISQVIGFSYAAKLAGTDISAFETGVRRLSQGLSENNALGAQARQALSDLGIAARYTDGSLRPMNDIFIDISHGLNAIKEPAERDAAAIAIFGRSGLELLPAMLKLEEGIKRAKELGLAPSAADIAQMEAYHKEITQLGAEWDKLVRDYATKPLALVVKYVLHGPSGEEHWTFPTADGTWLGGAFQASRMEPVGPPAPIGMKAGGGFAAMETVAAARGASVLKAVIASRTGSKEGYQQLLKTAEKTANEAWDALNASAGLGEKQVRALAKAWDEAHEKVLHYKAEVAGGFWEYKEEPAKFPKTFPSLFGPAGPSADIASALAGRAGKPYFGGGGFTVNTGDIDKANAGVTAAVAAMNSAYGAELVAKAKLVMVDLPAQALAHQERMVQLLSGPGGEIAAIQKIYELRLAGAKGELDIQDAINKRQEELYALHKQQVEQYVSLVQGATNALLSGGGGMGSFLKGQGMGLLSTISGNLARKVFEDLSKSHMLPHATEGTTFGRLLAGTPFGADPLKAATDANTFATAQNTAAIRSMTFGGGGSAAGGGAWGLLAGLHQWHKGDTIGAGGGGIDIINGVETPWGSEAGGGGLSMAAYLGIGAAAVGGGLGVYSGLKAGGARGGMTASGSALGAAGAIMIAAGMTGPAAPILLGAGMALGIITSLLGDPKQARSAEEQRRLDRARYLPQLAINQMLDQGGSNVDLNFRGAYRSGAPVIIVNQSFQMLDGRQIIDRHLEIGAAVARGIQAGTAGSLINDLRRALHP